MFLCKDCDKRLEYDERWDSYFCKDCNIWAEAKCHDITCDFCRDRPDKPNRKVDDRAK